MFCFNLSVDFLDVFFVFFLVCFSSSWHYFRFFLCIGIRNAIDSFLQVNVAGSASEDAVFDYGERDEAEVSRPKFHTMNSLWNSHVLQWFV